MKIRSLCIVLGIATVSQLSILTAAAPFGDGAFKRTDGNSDGFITVKEMMNDRVASLEKRTGKKVGAERKKAIAGQLTKSFKAVDKNEDGKLAKPEFVALLEAQAAARDSNKGGAKNQGDKKKKKKAK